MAALMANGAKAVPLFVLPTAMHAQSVIHDTPTTWLPAAAVGLGVDTDDHDVPFHTNACVL